MIRNYRPYIKYSLYSLFILILTACSAINQLSPIPPTITESPSPFLAPVTATTTHSPLPTQTPSSTPVITSPSPAPTRTEPPPTLVKRDCIPSTPGLRKDAKINGVIVMEGYINQQSYLLNMASGRKIFLAQNPREGLMFFASSSNRTFVAYMKPSINPAESRLVIMKANGIIVKSLPWEEPWRQIAGWLDENRLLISLRKGERNDSQADSLIILNPFTGEQLELLSDYPGMYLVNIDWYGVGWGGFAHSGTVYDPSLTRVVYYKDTFGISLLDLQTRQELVHLPGGKGNGPIWRPDGSGFIINLPEPSVRQESAEGSQWYEDQNGSLWYVNRDGVVRQLTNLQSYATSYDIQGYQWSPDGRQVAFRLLAKTSSPYPDIYPDTDPLSLNRLAILDMETGVITDTCIPAGESQWDVIWSPDGHYILVDDFYQNSWPQKGRAFLVSVNQGFAMQVAENVVPVGWLKDN